MGQQLRVRAKRQRRLTYRKRLKETAFTRKVTQGASRSSSAASTAEEAPKKAVRKAAPKKPSTAKKKAVPAETGEAPAAE